MLPTGVVSPLGFDVLEKGTAVGATAASLDGHLPKCLSVAPLGVLGCVAHTSGLGSGGWGIGLCLRMPDAF